MRSLFAAMRKGRKRKRGASLAMVLVSMTVLTIMGTLFTTIAMRSYQYSYSRLCRQQAYYTASSSVESFYNYVSSNPNVLSVMITQLNDACEGKVSADEGAQTYATIDPTTVRLKVGSTGGGAMTGDTVSLVPNGFFDLYLGSCTLWVRFNNTDRTEISVEAEATYNGYSETVRAIIARTNGAASELKKIFDNTFCLQSPITTIVAETTIGDIYVSQPLYERSAGTLDGSYYHLDDYDEVVAGLTNNDGEYKEGNTVYKGKAGQYLRDASGNIVTGNSKVAHYNEVLKNGVYGKAQASTATATLTGHTKPLDMDNSLLTASFINQPEKEQLWYNDWAELYMFSAVENGTAVEGNLYADSKILIGLSDRNLSSRAYLRRWDNTIKRSVFAQQKDGEWYEGLVDDGQLDNYLQDERFNYIDLRHDFEHGFGEKTDVFFDHHTGKDVLKYSLSTFRLNGDMYLWEDARIENFDSYDTDNVKEGKKNNIYAKKNLYIDGLYITDWNGALMLTTNTVSIGGDVVVQGDAQIMNAEIWGDVYCYGDELTIVSSTIHGNVYFDGDNFTSDDMKLDGNLVINYTGKNTVATSYNKNAGFDTTSDVGGSGSSHRWGATLTNSKIYGTLWSNVNTHIMASKWKEGSSSIPDIYHNIYVTGYLFIDLVQPYSSSNSLSDSYGNTPKRQDGLGSGYHAHWADHDPKDNIAAWNCFESYQKDSVIYADRFQLRTNQGDPWGYTIDISYLGTLIVGDGGLYIDGNGWVRDGNNPEAGWSWSGSRDSICIVKLITASDSPQLWETKTGNTTYIKGNTAERNNKLAGYVKSGYSSLSEALEQQKTTALSAFSHSNAVEYESVAFKDNAVWDDKLIKIRTWSAPVAGNKTEFNLVDGLIVKYVGEDVPNQGGGGNTLFGNPTTTTVANYIATYPDAFEVTDNGNTLIISDSVTFNCFADFSAYKRVIFDTSEGNIYVKFLYGAKFGNADAKDYDAGAEVVLTGGNMVFWHFYQDGLYDFKQPTLQINPFTRVGIVTASSGTGHGNDGLYIISNDDSLITMGSNAVLNGFVYTPHGHVFIAPSESSYVALNGCMAIESLIMLSTADEQQKSWIEGIIGGSIPNFGTSEITDAVIKQYENIVFNYVQPPLITDSVLMGGLTDQEVTDFNSVVWEFLGYY